ncbi:hypothetical protein N5923_23435 [Erwiniaceae bacterium BAC15a-03b]|uniref:Uncharacterized protein n=1 Tax=Winslowiella arboricola TaxID=2978220 RepID=A0A9J6PQ67_9GAMM|nr:hypothetical protein [Winslowiella arboricola]MCU5775097.1 hypothetical protein [Winslowiella arboricola]MCU5780449.1 hypothetical protein [Winslowiella arboricola]
MTAKVIPFKPKQQHQQVKDARLGILVLRSMILAGDHDIQAMDLLASKIADELYDYVETLEGR